MYRTLVVLGVAQCFGQAVAPMMVLLGGLVGARLAPSLSWATAPMAIMIVGTACTTIPASLLMSRIGRRAGFLIATGLAVAAGLIAAWSINHEQFRVFCLASFMLGGYLAFLQQIRFAVAESVPAAEVPKSLSILMLTGIVAAILGPEVAKRYSQMEGYSEYVGSFLGLSALVAISFFVLFFFYRNTVVEIEKHDEAVRPYAEILKNPSILLAIIAAVVGWSIMSLVMTATPVHMHEMDNHSLDDTTWVIQSHILAMYIPSLFSGLLITRFGVKKIIYAGAALMLGCVFVGYGKPALIHYWGSMVLLGVGWNFLFVGGTTLLTLSYRRVERFKVQALNDFLVFSLQAFGSLGAGLLLVNLGWNGVIVMSLPWIVLLAPFLWLSRRFDASSKVAG